METQTQMEMQTHVVTERQKKPKPKRVAAQLRLTRAEYRRMRKRAASEKLSFGQWLERAAVKELHRKRSI
jgi:hypothetical protein